MSAFKKKTRQEVKKGVTTVTRYARQLFAVSNVNGVSHIALAKTPGRRVFWVCLFTFSIIGWFYQTSALLEYYYEYRTVVKIEVSKVHEMPFPSMTICNANRIRRSEFCRARPDRCNKRIKLTRREVFNLTLEYLMEDKKAALGHQLQDMVISCSFSGSPELDTEQCLEYFQPLYQPNFGNCYVFSSGNGEREKLTVTEVDAWHELKAMTLVLNVELDEYLDSMIEAPGIVITFHEDMDYPEISTHGIHVHPDASHNIALEKVSVHLLPKPYMTNCTEYHDLPFHTLSDLELSPMICSVECLMHEQRKKCGHGYVTDNVVLYEDHMPYNPKTITKEDKQCADELNESVQDYCNTLCDTPCQ